MAKLTVQFKNWDRFKIDLRDIDSKVKKDLRATTADTARKIVDQAKVNLTQNKSVITGTLRRSMTFVFYERHIYAEIGTNIEYAPFVEFGTCRSRAKPYLRPAWQKYNAIYVRYLSAKLRGTLPKG
jgi:phage gpG-like protein